jgi:glycosyltransferase involved in cell wall biosynthesis
VLTVLTDSGYHSSFSVPDGVDARVVRRRFLKRYRVLSPFALHVPVFQYDVIHTQNHIPITMKPWIVTFESLLPRNLGGPRWITTLLRRQLLRDNCKALIAMSEWAVLQFRATSDDWSGAEQASKKVAVLHPTVPVRSSKRRQFKTGDTLQLVFVGGDFARKGGLASLLAARKLARLRVPVRFHIVSNMHFGPEVHTDAPVRAPYEAELTSPPDNVVFHGAMPNAAVLSLMQLCHYTLLPTLHDTFGFSVLEGFSTGTPAITSNVCALPEFVADGKTGLILSLPLDQRRRVPLVARWPHYGWDDVKPLYECLSGQLVKAILRVIESPDMVEMMSDGAIRQIEGQREKAIAFLDGLYHAAVVNATF